MKAPGFSQPLERIKMISWFQTLRFKCNLYRYASLVPPAVLHRVRQQQGLRGVLLRPPGARAARVRARQRRPDVRGGARRGRGVHDGGRGGVRRRGGAGLQRRHRQGTHEPGERGGLGGCLFLSHRFISNVFAVGDVRRRQLSPNITFSHRLFLDID
jgi:hypothetical protein